MLYSIEHEIHLANVKMPTILLINVKVPTIVGILTFISMINTTSEKLKASSTELSMKKGFITSGL